MTVENTSVTAQGGCVSSPATEILPDELIDAEHIIRTFTFDGADSGRARRALETLMSALRASQPTGGERLATIEECAQNLERSYPGHAWLNAACAATRSLATPAAMAQSSEGAERKKRPEPYRWPAKGDWMKFLGKNGYDFEREAALKIFEVDETYIVEDCYVQSWSHSVKFYGIPGRFNGVMFERVEQNSPEVK